WSSDVCSSDLAQCGGIGERFWARCLKGAQYGKRSAALAPGRIDEHFGGVAKASDPLGILIPLRKAVAPRLRSLGCELIDRQPLPCGFSAIDPRREALGVEVGK